MFSFQDDNDDDKCGLDGHVVKTNGSDSIGDFRTIAALRFAKFFYGNSDDFCVRLHSSFQKKLIQVDCHRLVTESVSNRYEFLDYNCITPTQHRYVSVVIDFL